MQRRPEPLDLAEEMTSETAFAELVHEHARMMYRVAYALLRHAQDAEDAVQDALLKLHRTAAWREMTEPKAFLARTVWRTAYDRMQGRLPAAGDDASLRRMEERPDERATPEAAALQSAETALLQALIDVLPEELRQPLLLSSVEELSSREIGLAMGIPEGTVRTRLMRARAELRREYTARNERTTTRQRFGEAAVTPTR